MPEQGQEREGRAPVRVVRVAIQDTAASAALFGADVPVDQCELVLRHMLPCPAAASLCSVLPHGLVLQFAEPADPEPAQKILLVPWGQVAYVRLIA